MDFTSLEFLFAFLPVFLLVYILSNQYNNRLAIILVASLLFVAAGQNSVVTLFWLFSISMLAYGSGYMIEKQSNRLRVAWVGVIGIVLVLFFFKLYSSGLGNTRLDIFLCENFSSFLCNKNTSNLVVPLGISYVTFQAISYIVDVYKKQIPHENNIFKFLSWILFYPKLISGPITSYKSIKNQLDVLETNADYVALGIRRIFTGVIQRLLIANQVGVVANAVFNMPIHGITPTYAWLGLLAYTLQIYFDFLGYTNIAIGVARIIGINLPENFNYPYVAESITDFWRRWHITLSTWFREYVFFPLERKRWRFIGRQVNVLIVFGLTGLWHGFNITFLIWGLLHGLVIAIETSLGTSSLNKIPRIFRHFYTLSIVMLGWVFFRSGSLEFAVDFIKKLFGDSSGVVSLPFSVTTPLPFIEPSFILIMLIGIIFSFPIGSIFKNLSEKIKANPKWCVSFQIAQDLVLILFFIFAIAAQVTGSFAPNIYAKF